MLGALLIHLIVGYGLAIWSARTVSPPVEDKPMELTIVNMTPVAPPKPKNTMFMETDESKKVPEPKEKTFESNANSIAASAAGPTGDLPMPSQEGKDRPSVDLETHEYSLNSKGTRLKNRLGSSADAATDSRTHTAADRRAYRAAVSAAGSICDADIKADAGARSPDGLARPTQQATATAQPQPPASSYRAYKERTQVSGRITTRGISSVNAVGTPLGRYQKFIFDAIGSRWYAAVGKDIGLYSIGTACLMFRVDRNGHIQDLKVVEKSSGEAFVNVCLGAVQEAQIPPMSEDLAETLPPEGLEVDDSVHDFP